MKRALFVFAGLACVQWAASQDEPPPPGSAITGMLPTSRSFIYFDLVHSFWVNAPDEIKNKFWSPGYNLGIYYEFFLSGNAVTLAPGLAVSTMTFRNNCELGYSYDGNDQVYSIIMIPIDESNSDVETSKLSFTYLDIPLELRIRFRPDERGKNFWMAPGFRAGVLLGNFWKETGESHAVGDFKNKYYGLPFTEDFHYGPSLRLGYHKVGLYGFYSLSDLFEENKAPTLTPFSLGLTLNPF